MYNGRFFIDHRMFYQNYIMNASMVVFRKNSRHPDKAYMNYRYVGDWLFWVGILLNGNTVYIDKQLNLFRQHAGNTTATSFSSGNNYKEMGRLMTDICRIVQPPRIQTISVRLFFRTSAPTFQKNEIQPIHRKRNFR